MYNSELYHWWYRVRRKYIHDLLRKEGIGKHGEATILDVGCGAGALMKELEGYGKVEGIDFSETAVAFCKSRGIQSVQKSGVESMPFADSTFDVVLAMDVLEHVKDDKEGMLEIWRVLKPGGIAIIFVPAYMFLWGITDVLSQHYRRYTMGSLQALVQEKFKIRRKTYFNTFLFLPIAAVRLFARFFRINMKDENAVGNRFVNSILYVVFNAERFFLRFMGFPFGVSCCIVAEKRLD